LFWRNSVDIVFLLRIIHFTSIEQLLQQRLHWYLELWKFDRNPLHINRVNLERRFENHSIG
jgi:hypothetical protein